MTETWLRITICFQHWFADESCECQMFQIICVSFYKTCVSVPKLVNVSYSKYVSVSYYSHVSFSYQNHASVSYYKPCECLILQAMWVSHITSHMSVSYYKPYECLILQAMWVSHITSHVSDSYYKACECLIFQSMLCLILKSCECPILQYHKIMWASYSTKQGSVSDLNSMICTMKS